MDGVLYRGSERLPGVQELLDALALRERQVMLATNNSMSTPQAYERKLAEMGIDIRSIASSRRRWRPGTTWCGRCPKGPASTS